MSNFVKVDKGAVFINMSLVEAIEPLGNNQYEVKYPDGEWVVYEIEPKEFKKIYNDQA
jgi:hypothetical protein